MSGYGGYHDGFIDVPGCKSGGSVDKIMKLPRGRFERFAREVRVSDVLEELELSGFTGSCCGNFGEERAELVYSGGRIVAACFCGMKGDGALSAILPDADEIVSAEIMIYNEARVSLSKELNPGCVVKGESRYSLLSRREMSFGYEFSPVKDEQPGADEEEIFVPPAANAIPDDELQIDEAEFLSIASGFRNNAEALLKNRNLDHLIVKKETETEHGNELKEETGEELKTEIENSEINEEEGIMTDYSRYQKMIVSTLARKLGPAAEDFAEDMAKKAGTRFTNIFPGNIEIFASHVEENAVQFISPEEAKFIANTIRRLKG